MFLKCVFLALVASFSTIYAASLPPYLTKCSLKDTRLGECLARSANAAIPILAKGDKHYDIPSMCPFNIASSIILKNDNDLKFILHNPQIHGIQDTLVSTMDFDGKYLKSTFINPSITVLANYEILGTIFEQPISGNGLANITLDRGIYKYNTSLPTQNRYGDIYFDVKNPTFSYETVQTIYNLDNLYCGAKFLGAQMNSLLNKNWQEVQQLFQPIATKVMRDFIHRVMSSVVKNVPVIELFKP